MKGSNERAGRNGRGKPLPARLLCGASLAVVALIGLPSVAHAQQDRNWDPNGTATGTGGSGAWDTSTPTWSPNGDGVSGPYAPWNNAGIDNAIFGGPNGTNAMVTLATPIIAHNLTFNLNTTYTLTGSTLTLAGTTPTITTNGATTINSILAGNSGLIKAGAGTLLLTGANTFSGGINVLQGRLNVSGDSALGAASNGITLSAGATLNSTGALGGARIVTLLSGSSSIGGGVGSAHLTGAGGFSLVAATTLSDDTNDFTGAVGTDSNTLYFTSIRNLGETSALGAPTTAANGAVFVRNTSAIYTGSGNTSNRDWSMAPFNVSGSSALRNYGTGTLTVTGNIGAGGGYAASVILDAQTADLALLGVISSNLANRPFIFTGGGTNRTITLAGANTFGGAATIQAVTVRAGSLADQGIASSLGTGAGVSTITFSGGTLDYVGTGSSSNRGLFVSGASSVLNDGTGALALSGAVTFNAVPPADTLTLGGSFVGNNSLSGVISGAGNLVMNGSAGNVWLLSGANTYVGSTTVTSGTLRMGNDQALGAPNALIVNGGALDLNTHDLEVTSLTGTGGNVALTGADLTVNGSTSTAYAGSITGSGGLIKRGTSTLTLTGQSTYTGDTTINGGGLALNFAAAGAPASNIISGASTLNMAGGTLTLNGAAGVANSQTFNGLEVTAGNNRIVATSGAGGSMTLNLGALTRTGGLMDFTLPASGTITTSNGDGALGWATINSTDYAQVQAGVITAFTAYANKDDASTWTTGDVVSDAGGAANSPYINTVTGSVQLGGLKYTAAANSTVTVGGGNTLGVDGTIIVASDVGNASQTITGGSITGSAGGGAFGVLHNGTGTGTFTIDSTIIDNGGTSLIKGGAGRVALTGVNSYTGGTTVSGGTLAINSVANGGVASSIGASSAASSNLVIESGTLEYTGLGAGTTDRGFTLTNGGPSRTIQVTNSGANLTFGGVVVGPDDAGFSKTGTGTLTLANAANTYTGVTTVSGGTLSVGTLANGGAASGVGASTADSANLVLQSGGGLQYSGGTAGSDRGFTLGSGGGRIGVSDAAATLTLSGTATGSGGLTKEGGGTLILSGTNLYAGGTTITAGTVRAGSVQAFGSQTALMTVNASATLDLAGFTNRVGALAGGGNVLLGSATLVSGGTNGIFSGTISGSGGFYQAPGGVQAMLGCNNSYTGVTTVNGSLSVDCLANGGSASGIGASGSASSNLVFSSGTLTYTGADVTTNRGFTLSGGDGAITVSSGTTTLGFTGQVTGGGRLRKFGLGTLVLSGTNTNSGGTIVDAGTLRAGSASAFGTGGMAFNSAAATLDLAGNNNGVLNLQSLGAGLGRVLLGGATLTITNGSNQTYSGTIEGAGSVVKSGGPGAAQVLAGCNSSYTGSTTVASGFLQVVCLTNGNTNSSIGASTAGAGNLVLNGGILQYVGAAGSTDRQFTLGSSGGGLDSSGTGAINFTATAPVALTGSGGRTLTLTGTNTGNNTLSARLDDPAGGTTALTKTGTGTWVLKNSASTYTGITTISGGVLGVDKLSNGNFASSVGASSAAASNLVIGNGSTLRYTGAGDTTNRLFTLSSGVTFIESSGTGAVVFTDTGLVTLAGTNLARTIALGGTNTGNNTLAGSIGNAGAGITTLAKNDSGTWVLTGNNTFTGNTVINDGNLIIGNGGATGNAGAGNVIVNAPTSTLSFNRSDTFNFTGTLSGPGSIAQIGGGTAVLTSAGNSIGTATISAGTLQVNGGLTTSTIAMTGISALTVIGTVQAAGANPAAITGDAGASTITVNAGATLAGNGDLGDGSDAVNLSGTLATGGAVLNLGLGADTLTLNDGGAITGAGINAGAGTDALIVNNVLARTLDAASVGGFESLTKQNSGVLTLTGAHSYSAGTTIAAGTLRIGNGGTSGSLAGDVTDNGALQFNRSDALTYSGIVSGAGSLGQIGSGTTILTGTNSYTGGTTISAGTLQIGNGGATGSISGNVLNNAALVFNRAGTLTMTGTIIGGGSVTQAGPGTTILTGANSYAGVTNVSAGTLRINGDQSGATGLTTVFNGARLGGSGTVGGSVLVQNGGTLAPGNSPGVLTINGDLSLSAASILDFEFGQANVPGGPLNDLVNVGGNLTLDGTINVTQSAGGSFGPGVYRIINYAGALTDNGLTVGALPSGTAFVQTAIANQVNLVNTAGMTLNFWDGAAGPKNDGLIQGGTGTWRLGGGQNNWTEVNGAVNADYAQDSFAVFQGTGGTVTVDNAGGNVLSAGMQFTTDGYMITGGPLTLTGTQAMVRTGDGSPTDTGITTTIGAALIGSAQLVKDLGGTLVLGGANSYTGGTAINGGTIRISSNANLGDNAGVLTLNGGTLNSTADMAMIRNVDLVGAGTFDVDPGTLLTLNGVVSGVGAIVKDGAGVLTLTAGNSYAGGTTVNAGILQIGNGGTTGAILGDVVDNGTLAFDRSDNIVFGGTVSGSGSLSQIGSGVLTLTADNSYTGTTNIAGFTPGTLQLGNGGTTGAILGDVVNSGTLVFNRSNQYSFAGTISGTGDVRQAGSGTTILTAANSYAGTTTVASGTLLVNGDQSAATGTTSVASGATLGGTGTIGGDAILAGGATLAPSDGTGPGTLIINGSLALAGTSRLDYDFGQSNVVGGPLNDLTQVGGNLALDGTIDVTVAPGGNFGPGLYRVVSYGGTLTDNGLALGALPPGALVSVQTSIAGQVNLVNATGTTLNFWDGATPANTANNLVDGGSGTWQNSSGNSDWTNTAGQVNGPYSDGSFAIFAAASGTVSVDNGLGAVTASGLQFASDGYTITGQDLTLIGPESTIRVGDGTTVGLGFTATIDAALAGSTQLVKADLGTLVLAGTNGYTGGTRIDAGTLRIASDANLGDAAGGLGFNGGTLNTTADISSNRLVNLTGNGSFATDAGTTLTLNGVVSGAGGLTKNGAGALVLTGANSYDGDTVVTAGSLFVNGDQTGATGLTSVASGATLGGRGVIGGNVTIANGATLAAGTNGVGTLTINGNLALSAGTMLDFEFGEANVPGGALNDLVTIGGDLTLDGTINVTVPIGGSFGPGIYRVFNYGGALTDNGLTLGTLPGGSAVSVQTAVAGQVNLVNTAGLTLSFWDGTVGPKNNGLVNGGNGVWRVGGGSSNWTDAPGALNADYTQDSFAIFSAAPGTVTVDNVGGNVLASGMQFASDGYVVEGGPLTLTGAQAIVQVGDGSAAGAGYTATIGAALTGSAGLVKTDLGTLVLTGTNGYSGGTAINGGTLRISSDSNLGAAGGGLSLDGGTLNTTATFGSSRAVNLVGTGTFATDGATALNLDGIISGAGALIKQGNGVLTLTANNSYSGGTTIAAGSLQIGNGGTTGSVVGDIVDNGELILARSNSYTIAGRISGTGAVRKGGGTAILTADNSYTGGTTNGSGILQLGDGGTTGSIVGDIINAGTLRFNRSNDYIFAGTISDSGGVEQAGSGTTILTGGNSYAGATSVTAGTLLVNGNQTAATGLTSVAANATLGGTGIIGGNVALADGGTLTPGAGGAGVLTINGDLSLASGSQLNLDFGAANAVGSPLNDLVHIGGDLTLDGTLNVAVTPGGAFDIGLYRIANYGGALTDNGVVIGAAPAGADMFVQTSVASQVNLINTGGATLNFWDGAAGPKFNGAVNGGDGVWQNGMGNNNWADSTGAVNAGYADGAFAIYAGAGGTVTVDNSLGAVTASGLQFAADGYTITGGALTLTGPQSMIRVGDGSAAGAGYTATIDSAIGGTAQLVKTDAGTLVLTGTNGYSGGTAINGGTVRVASDANLGDAAGGLSFNGGALNTTADLTSSRAVTLAGAGTFLTDAGTTLTLTGAVSGTGGLTKSGAGTMTLTGIGNYAGATNVAAGTMLVNGDFGAKTGATSVASGATLGGTGTIGGDVALASGATLTPGAGGAGTLTIGGDLSLAAGTTLAYEFGAANTAGGALNDLVNVGGDLTLDGTINVTVPTGGAFDVGVYRVFNYGGALTNNGLTLGALPAGSSVAVQTSIAGQVNLVNAAGLTLNFWDGAAGPKNNGVINGGTGIWQNGSGNDNWTDTAGLVNAAYSDGAFAVFGGVAGTVTVDNGLGQVTAAGMQFASNGYTIAGGGIALTGPQSTIRVGDGSAAGAGFTATINSALSGDTQLVKTDVGTLVLGGTNSYTGGTLINGGTVQIASDANLGAAVGTVTLDGGTLASSADVISARGLVMSGAGTLSTADATTFTFDGQLSGTGALTKAGSGTLLLTGDNGGYTTTTIVAGGTLAVTGTLGGAVAVSGGGRLEGMGQVGSVTNGGVVAPGRDGFGTLTVAGYTGSGGRLEIETALGGDGSQTDRLVVNGTTAGTTAIDVVNRGGLGAQTVEGIKIVEVTGASNGAFTLNGDYMFQGDQAVIAGAYGYRLSRGGVTTPSDGDWYLRSSLLNGGTPDTPDVPLYQPGVPIYEAYNQTLLTLTDVGTMQERIGNRQWAGTESGKTSGIWGRMQSNRSRPNAAFSTSLSDVNIDSWKMELGADHVLSERGDGAMLVLGVLGGYGEANASIASLFGNGSIKAKGYSAGATLSWFGPKGFYVDSRAQVTWFDSKLKSTVLGTLVDGNDGTGQAYSLEIGKRAPIGKTLSVTPQIQLVYSTVGFDRFTDPNGALVSSKLGDSLKTRWGLSIDRQDAKSHLYGVANLSYEWLDGTITDVSGTPIARENHRLWGELGLGGSVLLGDRLTLYSEASANTAVNDFGKSYSLKGTAGLRLAF